MKFHMHILPMVVGPSTDFEVRGRKMRMIFRRKSLIGICSAELIVFVQSSYCICAIVLLYLCNRL